MSVFELQSSDCPEGDLLEIWEQLLEKAPEKPFLYVSRPRETRVLKYSVTAFFKRVKRHALVFQKGLELNPGDKIALCLEDLSEFALLTHGALLAHLVVIPISRSATPAELRKILKGVAPKALFFPPALTATVAELLSAAPSVEHWVVTGEQSASAGLSATGDNRVVKRLENLLQEFGRDDFPRGDRSKAPSGVVFSPGAKFLSASSSTFLKKEQLLQKSWLMGNVLRTAATRDGQIPDQPIWTSAHPYSKAGFLFQFFLALFHPAPVLIRPGFHEREFWPQMLTDGIQLAVLSGEQFELLERKGRARGWRKPEIFSILVSDELRLDESVLSRFTERFHTPVGVSFFSQRLAEYLSLRAPEEEDLRSVEGESGEAVPSFGRLFGNASVEELPIASLARPNRYSWGTLHVQSFFGGELASVDIRATLIDIDGKKELYALGREADIVVRRGRLINLGRISTVVSQMKGVTYCLAVARPGSREGAGPFEGDYALYVMRHRLAEMNKYDVEIFLREHFKKEELPAEIVIEERLEAERPQTREDVQARLFGRSGR
ncbi:AMP-binding protein [bacterium]|nr:AMP-binding protein [bacterium]